MNEKKTVERLYNLRMKSKWLDSQISRTKYINQRIEYRKELETVKEDILQTRRLLAKIRHENMIIENRRGGK